MTDGKIIPGPWGKPLPGVTHEPASSGKPGYVDIKINVNEMLREVWSTMDTRAKCRDCGKPATREDGFCNACRIHRIELS